MSRFAASRLLATTLCTATLLAQGSFKPEDVGLSTTRLQRVHELVDRKILAKDIPGAVTLILRNGKFAYMDAQGMMDVEAKEPMPADAIFKLGSMTEPVISVALLMLVEDGKVRLTDPIFQFIPAFKDMKVVQAPPSTPGGTPSLVAADRPLTVRDLLTHTSGLGSGPISNDAIAKLPRKPADKLVDYVPSLAGAPLEFQPGTHWAHSQSAGFDTLGLVIERASGQPLDQFLRQRVFLPLRMTDTGFNISAPQRARLATLYQKTGSSLARLPNQTIDPTVYFSGSAGLSSTAEDYARFCQMLIDGGAFEDKQLLSPRSIELLSSPFVTDALLDLKRGEAAGLGVRIVTDPLPLNTLLLKGSFGGQGDFGTYFWIDRQNNLAAILMVQTKDQELIQDFETAALQSILPAQ